jgi:ABC-type polysaccharide/polyol phosphate transport system ATPase subunit
MSSDLLLSAHKLTKVYTGVEQPLGTLRRALFGTEANALDQYPVLNDIDLDIHRGETVGIMGRNGAGKTTLLGILGGVTEPTSGHVKRYGRIATLLGLTAGFNPNFTGRENAYLFCSIQGLDRGSADQRIGTIEAFAELGCYFDVPLRTYSSGMQARLAFSCAIHVDCDLIIIDETLAVGDANFRMKCYGRIRSMKDAGQTFLLVSHNQNMVANFCTRGIVLEGGHKVFDGATFDAVETYKRIRTEAMGDDDFEGKVLAGKSTASTLSRDVTLEDFKVLQASETRSLRSVVRARLCVHRAIDRMTINFGLTNQHGITVCALDGDRAGVHLVHLRPGSNHSVDLMFDRRLLPGKYFLSCMALELLGDVSRPLSLYQNIVRFEVGGSLAMSGIADLDLQISVTPEAQERMDLRVT